jgi:hypothetical protein
VFTEQSKLVGGVRVTIGDAYSESGIHKESNNPHPFNYVSIDGSVHFGAGPDY